MITDDDRSLVGAIAQALPRQRRTGWLVTPDTFLRWHRRRVQPHRPPGRLSTALALRRLVVEMTTNNPTWGYRRIHGELVGLGRRVGASTIWRILKVHLVRSCTANAPRSPGPSSCGPQAAVACDFATIDTVMLRRYYLLFFIDVTSREVFFAGITTNPTGPWTTQAARNLFLRHSGRLSDARALGRDRGSQFIEAFAERFDRIAAPRAPRPHHHLEPTPAPIPRRELHAALQHPPAAPLTQPAATATRQTRHRRLSPATDTSHQIDPLQRQSFDASLCQGEVFVCLGARLNKPPGVVGQRVLGLVVGSGK